MRSAVFLLAFALSVDGQGPENVLVVVNQNSALSRTIGNYYTWKRHIPLGNVCRISTATTEDIDRADYIRQIANPIAAFLKGRKLTESILYIVSTSGVPLRIPGAGSALGSETASVDSELTLLYSDMRGKPHAVAGSIPNPFFNRTQARFVHPAFPIYLVTRLTGYDFADVKAMVDRSLIAKNEGKFVIDLKSSHPADEGEAWLHEAARQLPKERVVLDESDRVIMGIMGVIGFASWGSNDQARKDRTTGFGWLAGGIITEFVSSNARTFRRPSTGWTLGTWGDPKSWFAGSPQTLSADYLHEGATGASGHVAEPYLILTPRPDILLPAYYWGRNLAESYYLAIPALSWMNIVVGDPLCSLGRPK